MEFRLVFDTITEQFDKYRLRYSKDLFDALIEYAGVDESKSVLELGPGTGQATDPILKTGCDYHAIELGEHMAQKMREKYGACSNFHLVQDDFITHDFGEEKYDMIYSAATIQWIPEEVAFFKTFALLKPGGVLAMMLTKGDYKTPNEKLFQEIQEVYKVNFKPEIKYTHGSFGYENALRYGYTDFIRRDFPLQRVVSADDYVEFSHTHCDHIVIPEPYKTQLYEGIRKAINEAGGSITIIDHFILMTVRKPTKITMKVSLQKASMEDAQEIWEMQKESFAELLEKYQDMDTNPGNEPVEKIKNRIAREGSFYYFIMLDGRKVGAIRIKLMPDGVEKRISPLFVLPSYRNQGIAQQAIAEAEQIHGSEHWALETIWKEKGNCHLYEKMGYMLTGRSEKINDKLTLVLYYK